MLNGELISTDHTMIATLKSLETDIHKKRKNILKTPTPPTHIKRRPDGMDYVDEAYMRDQLNKHYPLWTWKITDTQFLGSEWICVTGELQIIQEGITRKFGSIGATRIQFKKGSVHKPENIIDIDKNGASANTNAFKRAVNRLCNICDDVYRKIIIEPITDVERKTIVSLASKVSTKLERSVKVRIENNEINKDNYNEYLKLIEKENKETK